MTSDLAITGVEAISLRPPLVRGQCNGGQDARVVRVAAVAGIVDSGEVASNPMGARGVIRGPFSHTTAT